MIVVGITGPFGSGKTTAATFFATKGFEKITLSSFLEKQLRLDGKQITRKNLQDLGDLWRSQKGAGFLAKKALDFAAEADIQKLVIDGIRNLNEIEYFKKNSDFMLLGIVADREIRFERVKKMKEIEDLTLEEFNRSDFRDLGITEDLETGLQVGKCLAISDFFIDNDDDEKDYRRKLNEFLKKI